MSDTFSPFRDGFLGLSKVANAAFDLFVGNRAVVKMIGPCDVCRKIWKCLPFASFSVALILTAISFNTAAYAGGGVRIIRYDMGGSVEQRIHEVEKLRASGTSVRIEGTCVSACTLYLGLAKSCVAPNARLGFHGPRTRLVGIPMPRKDFDRQSLRMATYYPGQIRRWFMTEARMITQDYYTITGAQAAAMGARLCI